MTEDLRSRALDLALDDAAPTGDPDLDALVSDALTDLAAIRAGLEMLAEEAPAAARAGRQRRRRTRLAPLLAVAACIAAVAIVGGLLVRSSTPGSHPSSAGFVRDRYNYQPGTVGGVAPSFPMLPYSVDGLSSVSASSASDVWIIGSVAWHWDGVEWRSTQLPSLPEVSSLDSVDAIFPNDAWAAGSQSGSSGEIVATHPLLEHWDGSKWMIVPLPAGVAAGLESVSADSPSDVWAVGWWVPNGVNRHRANAAIRPLVAHWDGQHWQITRLQGRRATDFRKVVALAPNDVWATGSSQSSHVLVRHWDGRRWTSIRAPFGPGDPISGFTATSADDAWAVGSRQVDGHGRTLAAHWDGHTWMIAPTPNQNTDTTLVDVHATSPSDIWALGQSSYMKTIHNPASCTRPCTEIHASMPVAIYEHWNGTRWSLAPNSPQQMLFEGPSAITTAPDGSAWATGGCYFGDVVTRWNGHAWHPVHHPRAIHWLSNIPKDRRHPASTNCVSQYQGPTATSSSTSPGAPG